MWMNDLNGGLHHSGWYHMFYLHDPFHAAGISRAPRVEKHPMWSGRAPAKPNRYWGHARSRDLVHWENLPPAIGPARYRGELKPISGCSFIAPGGDPMIFYTSVGLGRPQEQWAAVGDADLLRWHHHPANPLLTLESHDGPRLNEQWRDCFVFSQGQRTFLILGAELPHGDEALIPIFEATRGDLSKWEYRGILFRKPKSDIAYFECPKFFRLQDRWVLVTSPYAPVTYFVGDFDPDTLVFTERTRGLVDLSKQHYASENICDADGRVWLMGWLPGWHPELNDGKWWSGCMSLPRLLSLDRNLLLRQHPAPQLKSLRASRVRVSDVRIQNGVVELRQIRGQELEIIARVDPRSSKRCGLQVGCSPNREGGLTIALVGTDHPRLEVDGVLGPSLVDTPTELRVFLDRSIVEVFADDGRICSGRKLASYDVEHDRVLFFAEGGEASLDEAVAWRMRSIW